MPDLSSSRWVLVPGTLCTRDVFTPLLDHLGVPQDQTRVILPDAPRVADYDGPLRDAVQGGEIVCGFSLGALVLAHNLGALAQARAVVLLASNPLPDPAENHARRLALRDRILAGGAEDWVTENWTAMSTDDSPALRERVIAMARATTPLIPAQTELAASRPGAQDDLERSALPLVFVTGAEDRLTPPHLVAGIADRAPRATLQVLEGLGHFALLEQPGRVAAALRAGLASVLDTPPQTKAIA